MNFEIVLASSNNHKVKEVREILSPYGIILYGLNDLNLKIKDIEENGATYKENALIKAKAVAELVDMPVIADDSGLEIEALDNAPGIYSARFASEKGGHDKAIEYILENVKENRKARFVCDIIALNLAKDPLFFEGIAEGTIADKPYGNGGFGYDPIFISNETGKCYAELDDDTKNRVSHRGKALNKLLMYLKITGKCKMKPTPHHHHHHDD